MAGSTKEMENLRVEAADASPHLGPLQAADDAYSSSAFFDDKPLSTPLPETVASFFSSVSFDAFPKPVNNKTQPWKDVEVVRNGNQNPSRDGKLIVACPRKCAYGSNNLGGL